MHKDGSLVKFFAFITLHMKNHFNGHPFHTVYHNVWIVIALPPLERFYAYNTVFGSKVINILINYILFLSNVGASQYWHLVTNHNSVCRNSSTIEWVVQWSWCLLFIPLLWHHVRKVNSSLTANSCSLTANELYRLWSILYSEICKQSEERKRESLAITRSSS